MSKNVLTLLTGSQVVLGTIHTAIVPEVVDFDESAPLTLENDKHEYLGTAEVTNVKTATFALLQKDDFESTSHHGTRSYPNALQTLAAQVQGFSQLDKVSLVTYVVQAVSDTGLTINAAPKIEVVDEPDTPVPSEEEQYAGLATVADIATDVEGNQ